MNKSFENFESQGKVFAQTNYCNLFLCNVAQYGGSAIFSPLKRDQHSASSRLGYDGESYTSRKVNLKNFRENLTRNKKSNFIGLPENFRRDNDWWEHNILIDKKYSDCQTRHKKFIESVEEIINIFSENKRDLEGSIELIEPHLKDCNSPRQIMQLNYLLEDLKNQSESLIPLRELSKSHKIFATADKSITGFEEMKPDFIEWDRFVAKFNLSEIENNIKILFKEVADHCVRSCINYPDVSCRNNVLSMKINREGQNKKGLVILITPTDRDKRELSEKDIVLT